ncbi:hypothetical protein LIQ46_01400 [Megasphaera elsdenii]|uniref:hypothetical protein n=1 Tax=Megasphaera TaxID=906 RepID=UPI0008E8AF1D|nr:hypothetical protein [Megasphaera elsdenii]MCB5701687.1 hypothetical protein [Megasphaera elsdenii]MCB5726408.1 hypothetical protein [Megasphaera elsdenii]MCB5770187.1 hypothetical protein [Megasphaera elsdenii]MDY5104780.1 hypothetical protein [Megasphaera elsdenii]SFI00052.1 hypothetical protein SAMN02910401_00860 [Megasphaera elsdenii]
MKSSMSRQNLRRSYLICYIIGTICTVCAIALLAWVAICIALEKEPLASVAFLPDMPVFAIFMVIIAIAAISVAAWQYGATFHQRYEALTGKEGPDRVKHEKE